VSERRLRAATVVLALGGAAIAAYLSYTRLTDTSIMCPTSGCAAVQRSSYSELAGVPVAYLGVAGYLAIALSFRSRLRCAALVFAAVVLIGDVCVWCLASDCVLALLLAVSVLRRRVADG
jgi:uncharacterized membrane protein